MPAIRRLALTFVSALCAGPVQAEQHTSEYVTKVTEDSFDEYSQANTPLLLMMHVDWCGVCKRTFPLFTEAAEEVGERGIGVAFAHAECQASKPLCTRFNVTGYPTILYFDGTGPPRKYQSPRDRDTFVRYAERMTQPAVQRFSKRAAFGGALRKETFAAFVAEVPEGDVPAGLQAAAERLMDKHLFARVTDLAQLLPKSAAPPPGARMAVLSMGKQQWPGTDSSADPPPGVSFYDGPLDDASAVDEWIQANRFPGIWQVTASIFYEFTHARESAVLVAFNSSAVAPAHEAALRGAAKDLPQLLFGVLDGVLLKEELKDFNFHVEELPRAMLTEERGDKWIEDVEVFRVATISEDLRSILGGSPVLRQCRDFMCRVFFYKREAFRFALRVWRYAQQGYTELAIVLLAFASLAVVLLLVIYLLKCLIQAMLLDPEDDLQWTRDRPKVE